jgi:translation initiation factor 2 subunit 1
MAAIKPRKPLPDVGEIVVGTVKEIYDYGAYLTLDEYGGIQAFLPWSEIATRMVRNIRQVLREGQKVAVKVIRVYRKRNQVDVSLKRVSDSERRRKMIWWKRTLKAAMIAEIVAKKIGKPTELVYDEVVWPLDDYYGDALTGLEQAVIIGERALREAGVKEEWIKPLLEEAKARVEVKKVKISGVITAQSLAGDGVDRVRKVLATMAETVLKHDSKNIKVKIYTIGAPRYRIDLTSHDYKILEKALQEALQAGRDTARKLDVTFEFQRLKI